MLPQKENKLFFRAAYNFYLKAKTNKGRQAWLNTAAESQEIYERFNKDALIADFMTAIYKEMYRTHNKTEPQPPLEPEREREIFTTVYRVLEQAQAISNASELNKFKHTADALAERFPEELAKDLIQAVKKAAIEYNTERKDLTQ